VKPSPHYTRSDAAGVTLDVAHKSNDVADPFTSNGDAFAAVARGAVVGGTAWLWADDHAEGALDYLIVDEAGQMALDREDRMGTRERADVGDGARSDDRGWKTPVSSESCAEPCG